MSKIYKKIAFGLLFGVAGFSGAAEALPINLVQNGNFSTATTPVGSSEINYLGTSVANWAAAPSAFPGSYSFIFLNPGDTAAAQFGPVSFWTATADTLAGGGGNFIAMDPQFLPGSLSQTITGLTIGKGYTLTFDYAGAQQNGFSGPTTEGFQASLGGQTQNTGGNAAGNLNDPSHGFTGWFSAAMNFTATGSSELLSFMADGGPNGAAPPFALLDNVSLVETVPEPMTLSVFGIGLVGAAAWKRRKASKKA